MKRKIIHLEEATIEEFETAKSLFLLGKNIQSMRENVTEIKSSSSLSSSSSSPSSSTIIKSFIESNTFWNDVIEMTKETYNETFPNIYDRTTYSDTASDISTDNYSDDDDDGVSNMYKDLISTRKKSSSMTGPSPPFHVNR